MDITAAVKNPAGKKRRKRVGRGNGSGHGKTSGKGHKGQRSRSSVSVKGLAEGGQRPLFRRIPKRGFNNERFKTYFADDLVGRKRRVDRALEGDEVNVIEQGRAGDTRPALIREHLLVGEDRDTPHLRIAQQAHRNFLGELDILEKA